MAIRQEIQLHKAILYDKLPDNRVKCNVCQRRCTIAEGKMGVCLTRINKAGELYSTIYGIVSSMHADLSKRSPSITTFQVA